MKTEIINNPVDEIDWNKPQLLKSKYNDNIVISNGYHFNDGFQGTIVHDKTTSGESAGWFYREWTKTAFEFFDGKLILSNK